MGVRLFALAVLGFALAAWSMVEASMPASAGPVAHAGVGIMFGALALICVYGVATGKAP